jgi:hypothetical protein
MKTKKYTGLFISAEGKEYTLTCNCFGFLEAFFLLTAEAIKSGRHYQLNKITSEDNFVRHIDDINKCSKLII